MDTVCRCLTVAYGLARRLHHDQPVHGVWNGDYFDTKLFQELEENADELPMQDWCEHGGSVRTESGIGISDLVLLTKDQRNATGTVKVSFVESYHSRCRDIEGSENQSQAIAFSLVAKAAT